jgi:hypothetical protein
VSFSRKPPLPPVCIEETLITGFRGQVQQSPILYMILWQGPSVVNYRLSLVDSTGSLARGEN